MDSPDVIPADKFVEDQAPSQGSGAAPDVIPADQFVSDEDKYGTAGQQLKTAAEHAASSATFGLSTAAETGLGIATPEAIRARTEENPIAATAGSIAGLLVPGAPEAEALGIAGKAGANALGLGAVGSKLASKVGAGVVKGAIENAIFQGGDEVSKHFAEDPDQTSQTAIADIGLSSLIGGGIGGAFGAVSPLWNGSKANKFVDEMKTRLNEHLTNPDLATQTADELSSYHSDTTKGSNDLYYGQYESGVRQPSVKDQAIAKLVPELNDTIIDKGVKGVSDNITSKLEEMKADPDTYQKKFTKALEKDFNAWQEVVNTPNAKASDIYFATEDLKRNLQNRSKIGIPIDNTNPAFDSIQSFKKLAVDLRKGLEDTNVWGDAGKFQRDTNQAFTKFAPALKDFNQSFTTRINGVPTVDPDKVQTYLNLTAKDKGAIRSEKLQNYLDAGDKYREAINDAHAKIDAPQPFDAKSVNSASMALDKLSPGARAADSIVKNLVNKSGGELAGSVGGVIAGWPGYMVGKHVAGPVLDSVVPNLIKPLLGSAADGTALKHAIDYMGAFAKGEAAINRGVSNVFKAGKEAIPASLMPSDKEKSKLDKTLLSLRDNPEPLTETGGKVANYLPNHGQSLAQTAANAVNYLNSQRPKVTKISPLDADQEPDPMSKDNWNRTLDIAQQPLSILQHIKNGTVQTVDVKTMAALYPGLYQKITGRLMSEIANQGSKDQSIPYVTRMGLSLFAGQALDSTMTPAGILGAQTVFAQNRPPPQQAQQRQKKPTAASAKAMNAVTESAMTPIQARAAERSRSRA
jgi:hypothetical protein